MAERKRKKKTSFPYDYKTVQGATPSGNKYSATITGPLTPELQSGLNFLVDQAWKMKRHNDEQL